jgi:hypothetical protein
MKKIILGLVLCSGLLFGNQFSDNFVNSVNILFHTYKKSDDAIAMKQYSEAYTLLQRSLKDRQKALQAIEKELVDNEQMHDTIVLWKNILTHFPIYNRICVMGLVVKIDEVVDDCYANLDKIEDTRKMPQNEHKQAHMKNFYPSETIIEAMGYYNLAILIPAAGVERFKDSIKNSKDVYCIVTGLHKEAISKSPSNFTLPRGALKKVQKGHENIDCSDFNYEGVKNSIVKNALN